tara:strand:+ start:470 stop:1369 length:900 start_codon:yes stop_codon:yes gene_type:complete
MATLSALKKSRNSFMEKLHKEIEKIDTPQESKSYIDDRFWKPEVEKSGNGYAVIRFLPPVDGEDIPWARVFNHGFQGPTGLWYIENSLTTLGKKDPVSEYNSQLWNSGIEANKEIARKQKRRLTYISNIYVVSDPKNPQNEGKVFLYKYGKKIFNKINDLMNPEFEDESPVNPFDFWEGANFKLKIRRVEGYQNYDKSEFDSCSQLLENEEELEKVWNSQHPLSEFSNEEQFKTYDELKARLDAVLALDTPPMNEPVVRSEPKQTTAEEDFSVKKEPAYAGGDDEDEDLSYFAKLAEDN